MIQVVFIILMYVLGPAIVVVWAVRRYRSGVRPDLLEILGLLFVLLMLSIVVFNYSGSVSDEDNLDAQKVRSELIKAYQFPLTARYQDGPALFVEANRRELVVRIYGVLASQEHTKIKELARKIRKELASKPIEIHFFESEVWEENPDGSRYPLRGSEVLVDKFRIE